jgi:hypothetical protein
VEAFNVDRVIPEKRISQFDKDDHNLLGVLQLVAKGLEVWFGFVCLHLVYLVTVRLASRKEGLPVGYLTRPGEFMDVHSLFDPLLWTSLPTQRTQDGSAASRWRIWLFVGMTLSLCGLCNLMGPATAVLVIPALQWVHSPKIGNLTFGSLNAANPPSTNGFMMFDTYNCTAADIWDGNFSCTAYDWAYKLDGWFEGYVASAAAESWTATTVENLIMFTVNSSTANPDGSYDSFCYWIPNRQLVNGFYSDVGHLYLLTEGQTAGEMGVSEEEFESYVLYNKSLQVSLAGNFQARVWSCGGAFTNMCTSKR